MPRITQTAADRQNDAMTTTSMLIGEVIKSPTAIVAVQRKANIGNFETIDIYAGVALPLDVKGDFEFVKEVLTEAIDKGFAFVSEETGERYRKIKETIKAEVKK